MLYYDRIDVSRSIDVNTTSESKEYIICHYWHFLDKVFMFQQNVSSGCHDVLMMSMKLSDIVILNIHSVDYCCITNQISKSEAKG